MSNTTTIVRTNAALHALDLSYYTLCRLSDFLLCVDPRTCLEQRLARDKTLEGKLTLDSLGNFVSFA